MGGYKQAELILELYHLIQLNVLHDLVLTCKDCDDHQHQLGHPLLGLHPLPTSEHCHE